MFRILGFWGNNPSEEEKLDPPQRVLQEMKRYHYDNDVKAHAERKYDYDDVYELLTNKIEELAQTYNGCLIVGKEVTYKSETHKQLAKKKECEYLDLIVSHKQFVFDHPKLKRDLAERIINLNKYYGMCFDWHYLQLFHRDLNEDTLNNKADVLNQIDKLKKPFVIQTGNETSDEESEDF